MPSSLSGQVTHQINTTFEAPLAWDLIESGKYLLSDSRGTVALLLLEDSSLRCSPLGRVDGTSVVRYLDNRVFFAGSYAGPSHLIRIDKNRLDFLFSFANSGPIIDITAVQGETPEEIRFVGAGGYDETAAVLEIRSGVECHVISDETPELEGTQLPFYMGLSRGDVDRCVVSYADRSLFYDISRESCSFGGSFILV